MPFICLSGVFEPDSAAVSPLQLTSGIYVCRLFRLDRLSITNPSSRFPVLQFGAQFSTLVISSPACSVSQSCDFQSCSSVPSFPLSWFPVLQFSLQSCSSVPSFPLSRFQVLQFSLVVLRFPVLQFSLAVLRFPVLYCGAAFSSLAFSAPPVIAMRTSTKLLFA